MRRGFRTERICRGLVLAVVGLGAGAWGCSAAGSRPLDPEQVSGLHRQIDVAAGQTFALRLPANHSTGYRWELAAMPEAPPLRLVNSTYQVRADQAGAGGYEVWTFRTSDEGIAQLAFRYVRAGEKSAAPVRTASFDVFVLNEPGSRTYQQQRALRGATWNPDDGAGSFR